MLPQVIDLQQLIARHYGIRLGQAHFDWFHTYARGDDAAIAAIAAVVHNYAGFFPTVPLSAPTIRAWSIESRVELALTSWWDARMLVARELRQRFPGNVAAAFILGGSLNLHVTRFDPAKLSTILVQLELEARDAGLPDHAWREALHLFRDGEPKRAWRDLPARVRKLAVDALPTLLPEDAGLDVTEVRWEEGLVAGSGGTDGSAQGVTNAAALGQAGSGKAFLVASIAGAIAAPARLTIGQQAFRTEVAAGSGGASEYVACCALRRPAGPWIMDRAKLLSWTPLRPGAVIVEAAFEVRRGAPSVRVCIPGHAGGDRGAWFATGD